MPVTEADVGITEFLGKHRPFRAVLKQSINDFVVNEVMRSGKIAKLNRPAAFQSKQLTPSQHPAAQSETTSPADLPLDKLQACFEQPQREHVSDLILDAVKSESSEVLLPVCSDKQKRRAMHEWVRNHIPQYITDTVTHETDGVEGQAVRLRLKKSCRPWKRRRADVSSTTDAAEKDTYDPREEKELLHKRREWREDAPPAVRRNTYVQFVLWKRNMDTMEALNSLSKILRIPPGAFTYAGTKDKRAITTQLVQVRGISETRFAHANRTVAKRERGLRAMTVGDVEILPPETKSSLGLGDLRGNRFTIALRDLDVESEGNRKNVEAAMDSVKKHGFVNYFGLQRFGSGVSGTHETGFAFLRGDFQDVCRRILLPLRLSEWGGNGSDGIRPERRQLNEALDKFGKKEISAAELLRVLPRWMHIETAIVSSFAHDEDHQREKFDYRAAFDKLPRNLRRMYGHAVQSYLWNVMASERVCLNRPDDTSRMHAIKGDLVLANPNEENEMNYETAVREVTEEEERQKSVSVFRVLIPVLGSEVALRPDTPYAKRAQAIMKEQQIDMTSRISSDYGMKGTYRLLLSQPKDMQTNISSYSKPSDVLIEPYIADISRHRKSHQDDPTTENEDCERHPTYGAQHSKEDATDVAADRKCDSYASSALEKNSPVANGDPSSEKEAALLTETIPNCPGTSDESSNALIIAFTLGRGEFATMLVRELTRENSSTANQKAMQQAVRGKDVG